ncbi:MAG: type II toxin-antitoxin system VapC family toxin, partial [Thermomicrobiales bacterium]
ERQFESLLSDYSVSIEPVTRSQAAIGRLAYRSFGKLSGHRARLNFGDCFTYALAAELHEPLLFKGNDFIHTDLQIVTLSIDSEGA